MRHSLLLRLLLLSFSVSLPAQTPAPEAQSEAQPKRYAMPLADVLKAALDKSSLTIPGSHPFHVKLVISDVLHPDSGLQAEIEEYWSSPTLWKRTVTGPGLRQVITRNETGEHFETTGDYFPQWLANFVTALTDPVPGGIWNRPGLEVHQSEVQPGVLSTPCADLQLRFDETSSVPARLCFLPSRAVASVTEPGYLMEFAAYAPFHAKTVPRLYLTFSGGTVLAGRITALESANKKPDFFNVDSPAATATNPLTSIMPSVATVKKLLRAPITVEWPAVHGGMTEGNLAVMVSVDEKGVPREASILQSDNPQLNATALAQLPKTAFIPAITNGAPVQVAGLLVLPFSTKGDAPAVEPIPVVPLTGTAAADHALVNPKPQYPLAVSSKNITGDVVLLARIDREGSVTDAKVVDSPAQSMTDIALATIKQWKYTPFEVEGIRVEAVTTITVNFTSP